MKWEALINKIYFFNYMFKKNENNNIETNNIKKNIFFNIFIVL